MSPAPLGDAVDVAVVAGLDRVMTGKKDDACGGDSGLDHDVDPMRHLGGHGPAGYSSGPTHTDRADFTTDDAAAPTEASTEAPAEAEDEKTDAPA